MKTPVIKILVTLTVLIILINRSVMSQGILIESGASISCTGAPTIQVDNGNFVNNGTFTKGNESVTLSGSTIGRTISGTTNPNFYNLTISNSAGVTTQLGTLTATNLNIETGSSLIVAAGKNLTISNFITNDEGVNGLILLSDATGSASLQNSTSDVPATIHKYINADLSWHFLSSPVSQQDIWPEFSPAPSGNDFGSGPFNWDFFYFNPNAGTTYPHTPWVNLRKTDGTYNDALVDETGDNAGFGTAIPEFQPARGYLVAYSPSYSETDHQFEGILNTGAQSYEVTSISGNEFNLLGNPYSSSIDWKSASGWDRTPLYGDDVSNGRDYWCWNQSAGNYGTFNSLDPDDMGTNGTGRYIAPMQGFFVAAAETGTISMNNAVRAHSTQAWLKSTSGSESLKLRLSCSLVDYYDEVAIHANSAFTGNGTVKFGSMIEQAPELYIQKDQSRLSVLRLPLITENDEILLGVKSGLQGEYVLSVENPESMTGSEIFLDDLDTHSTWNLKTNHSYSFQSTAGDHPGRFKLRFGDANSVPISTGKDHFRMYSDAGCLFIETDTPERSFEATVSTVLGQILYNSISGDSGSMMVPLHSSTKVYIVTIKSDNQVFSRKILKKD